ncbi:MAG: hypothetical protein WDW38_011482 [Sanguina aurantia]
MSTTTALLLLLTSSLPAALSQSDSVPRYAIDFTQVDLSPATSKNLTSSCICDLNPFECDIGCCCDALCPASLTAATAAQGRCLPQGYPNETLAHCIAGGYVKKVNLPANGDFYEITVVAADQPFFSQLMCIVSDSNPALGGHYPDPTPGNANDNSNLAQCLPAEVVPSKGSAYLFGSYVYMNRNGAVTHLTLPYPALSNECSDEVAVGFLQPLPSGSKDPYATCTRTIPNYNLSQACGTDGALSPTHYSQLAYLRTPLSQFDVPVSTSIQYLDPVTGQFTALPSNATAYIDPTTGDCVNAVQSINVTVSYSLVFGAPNDAQTPGSIQQVQITLVVSSFQPAALLWRQSSRLTWVAYNASAAVTPVLAAFSGNPGYLIGYPVLAGTLLTDPSLNPATGQPTGKRAISGFVAGLPLGAPGPAGACSPTALTPLRFGTNTTSSCSIALTAPQLADFCVNQTSNPDKYVAYVLDGLYASILSSGMFAGIWGNSNYSNTNEWIQVTVSGLPFSQTIYSVSDQACTGVITGYDIQVLTGVAFAANNLQSKVLFVNLCFRSGTWAMSDMTAPGTAQRFYLTFAAHFLPLRQAETYVMKPAPPLLIPLSKDILYPFLTSAASTNSAPSLWLLVLLPLLVMLVAAAVAAA